MLNKCPNCGSKIEFSPKNKGNRCLSCNSFFSVKFDYNFKKKTLKPNNPIKTGETLTDVLRNVKCKSCGASMLFNKYEVRSKCPYCGTEDISKASKRKLMEIDSIVPFNFDKEEAVTKFKHALNKTFLADKKHFKELSAKDIQGAYVNAFVFDFSVKSTYKGKFSYETGIGDDKKTRRKNVEGIFEQSYNNIVIEANSNLNQDDFMTILPYNYDYSVKFDLDFIHGYHLEYQDRLIEDCVAEAEKLTKKFIERDLLITHNCTKIEELTLDTEYVDRKYNYSLVPVYFITKTVKNTTHTVIMNGQTGKVGKIPKDKKKETIFYIFIGLIIIGFLILFAFLSGK